MNPTSNPQIRESDWFCDPNEPLIEYKVFSARVGNIMHYICAKRGITPGDLKYTEVPLSVELQTSEDIADNSRDQFNKLEKFLKTPAR